MSITILDPRNEPPASHDGIAPRPAGLKGRVIGVIDNGKSNSRFILQELTDILRKRHGFREVVFVTKPSSSHPLPQKQAEELAGRCDAVLAGIGD